MRRQKSAHSSLSASNPEAAKQLVASPTKVTSAAKASPLQRRSSSRSKKHDIVDEDVVMKDVEEEKKQKPVSAAKR